MSALQNLRKVRNLNVLDNSFESLNLSKLEKINEDLNIENNTNLSTLNLGNLKEVNNLNIKNNNQLQNYIEFEKINLPVLNNYEDVIFLPITSIKSGDNLFLGGTFNNKEPELGLPDSFKSSSVLISTDNGDSWKEVEDGKGNKLFKINKNNEIGYCSYLFKSSNGKLFACGSVSNSSLESNQNAQPRNSGYLFETKVELQTAIDLWISDEVNAIATYGVINTWDVSTINDFSQLFDDKEMFNSDISSWDVSNGTDFSSMFTNATSFDQDIGSWDVSNGTDFTDMFRNATSFNQDITDWEVDSEAILTNMFLGAELMIENQDASATPNYLYFSSEPTLYVSDDGGNTWNEVVIFLNSVVNYIAESNNGNLVAVGQNNDKDRQIAYSNNKGTSWTIVGEDIGFKPISVVYNNLNGQDRFFITGGEVGDGLWYNTDNELTNWKNNNPFGENGYGRVVSTNSKTEKNVIVVGGIRNINENSMFYSIDNGDNWNLVDGINIPNDYKMEVLNISYDGKNGKKIFVASGFFTFNDDIDDNKRLLYYSTDGSKWKECNINLDFKSLGDKYVDLITYTNYVNNYWVGYRLFVESLSGLVPIKNKNIIYSSDGIDWYVFESSELILNFIYELPLDSILDFGTFSLTNNNNTLFCSLISEKIVDGEIVLYSNKSLGSFKFLENQFNQNVNLSSLSLEKIKGTYSITPDIIGKEVGDTISKSELPWKIENGKKVSN